MALIIVTGNLTKDPELKRTQEGKKYYLLQLAENIPQRDEKGNIIKDENGHTVNKETYYHSVFVNDYGLCFAIQNSDRLVEKGSPIKVVGVPKFKTMKDSNDYDVYAFDRIVARSLDLDPFHKAEEVTPEQAASEKELEKEDIPL